MHDAARVRRLERVENLRWRSSTTSAIGKPARCTVLPRLARDAFGERLALDELEDERAARRRCRARRRSRRCWDD